MKTREGYPGRGRASAKAPGQEQGGLFKEEYRKLGVRLKGVLKESTYRP